MKFSIFIITLLFSSFSFADRSVSIAATAGSIDLVNPSNQTVNYTIECYDKVSGSNIIAGGANVTLASKASVKYGNGNNFCSNSATLNKALEQGVSFCTQSVNFANAINACAAGASVCTISKLKTDLGITESNLSSPSGYWISPSATAWGQTYDGGTKWNAYDTTSGKKTYAPATGGKGTNYKCSNSPTGGAPELAYCQTYSASSSASGTLCCPNNNGFASCKVTIHGTAATSGHLQSPQFKGGASF